MLSLNEKGDKFKLVLELEASDVEDLLEAYNNISYELMLIDDLTKGTRNGLMTLSHLIIKPLIPDELTLRRLLKS